MERLNDLQEYLAREFVDEYREGRMTRRELIRRILYMTGGVATAASILASLGCEPAPPASPTPSAGSTGTPVGTSTAGSQPTGSPRSRLSVPASDPTIDFDDVSFAGDGITLLAYLARPKGSGLFPAIMVCHENRGLVEHIRDVTRRLAKAGYVGLAVDLLSRDGGSAKVDPSQVPAKLSANPGQAVSDFQAAFRYLRSLPYVRADAIGMLGFCFGGGITWLVATAIPELKAAVPFYGPNPPLQDVSKIAAAVLAIYGGEDQRINAGIPAIEEAMRISNKTFEKIAYPGAGHAFHNDTGPNWNEQAAAEAWHKTLEWFERYVG